MPATLPTQAVNAGRAAVSFAQRVRETHARRSPRGSAQREADIKVALERLRTTMEPLRSEIGRFPYGPKTPDADANRKIIYDLSQAIQRERRKLWKMQERKRGKK